MVTTAMPSAARSWSTTCAGHQGGPSPACSTTRLTAAVARRLAPAQAAASSDVNLTCRDTVATSAASTVSWCGSRR
ncbi:hypothetical protein [Micromonospora sp. CNB394]|uniref:hypothetical protein n=1 Tax=Micromonospora sp. CNB394 TaxID=1169151 RepID=UPI0003777B89|nr:hypothetical protein [Micromonospora sp. CNB394]